MSDWPASVQRVVDAASEALAAVQKTDIQPTGVICVSAPRLLAEALMTPVLRTLADRYPDVVVEILLTERTVDVTEEGIDVALSMTPEVHSGLHTRELGHAPIGFVASPDYLRERGTPTHLSQLTDLPIGFWDERLSTVAAERALLEADTSRAKRAEVIDHVAAGYILQGVLDRLRFLKG